VPPLHDAEMSPQRLADEPRQNREAVPIALASTDHDVIRGKVDVLHAKPSTFEEPQATAVGTAAR
jgi:hypothetical protein